MKTILVMILVLALGLAVPCNFAFSCGGGGGGNSGGESQSGGASFTSKDDLKNVKGSCTSTSRPSRTPLSEIIDKNVEEVIYQRDPDISEATNTLDFHLGSMYLGECIDFNTMVLIAILHEYAQKLKKASEPEKKRLRNRLRDRLRNFRNKTKNKK